MLVSLKSYQVLNIQWCPPFSEGFSISVWPLFTALIHLDMTSDVPVLPDFLQNSKPALSPSVSGAVDGGETSGESPSTHQMDGQVRSLLCASITTILIL